MIDFHTHLDLHENPMLVAKQTSEKNAFTLSVTTSPRAWLKTPQFLRSLPNIRFSLGLHPEVAFQKKAEVGLLLELVAQADFIGEVGMDGSRNHRSTIHLQKDIMDALLKECAARGGRILSIHSRGAVSQIMKLLEKYPDSGIPVLHWFCGSKRELEQAISLGCWFSFGPAGLLTRSGRSRLAAIPLSRLLPESDGPFATIAGSPVMPWDAQTIVPDLCELHGL